MAKKYPSAGHRQRLRQKFLVAGLDGFLDYEIIELLLTLGTPRKDCKQSAKKAIKKFGGLKGVLNALPEDLQQIKGIGPHSLLGIKLFQSVAERYQKSRLPKKISFDSPQAVAAFLQEKLGREKKEQFMVLCLDAANQLIKISTVSVGTLNANLIHPREVFHEAILNHAAKVIIAHNHPSGRLKPSQEDIQMTEKLTGSARILDIKLEDHLIISKDGYFSFREKGLLDYVR